MSIQNSNDLARLHVWVSGRVQGVGFRAFAQEIGGRLGLTGWVRNLGDVMVETVAEGHRSALEHFREEVSRGPRASHVDEARVEWETSTGEFQFFDVLRSI